MVITLEWNLLEWNAICRLRKPQIGDGGREVPALIWPIGTERMFATADRIREYMRSGKEFSLAAVIQTARTTLDMAAEASLFVSDG
jgi:hypothetical protein